MSKHNRERRQFRKLAKAKRSLTGYQTMRTSKHGKRDIYRITILGHAP